MQPKPIEGPEMIARRSKTVVLVSWVLVLLASCQQVDPGGVPETLGSGGASPQETVEALVEALESGDFDSAVSLAVADHAALATLAEGATFGQVADALRSRDPAVVSNFWAGFAQGAGSFLTGAVQLEAGGVVERDGIEYYVVRIIPESGGEREVLARDDGGYRVDVFASFAPGLASRMVGPVERLLSAQTADARLVLAELRETVPSLLVAAERPQQPPDVVQAVLRLVELITRVG